MRRRRNWGHRLVMWQKEVLGEPFVWGETDCGSLVWRALHEMYRSPPIEGAVPAYESAQDARRAHLETGGVGPVLRRGGAEEVGLNFARQGDVLVGVGGPGELPGAAVVVERHFVVTDEEEGVSRRRLRDLRLEAPEDVAVLRPPE